MDSTQFHRVARPVRGRQPSDVVRSFVFMANLAAQEITGQTGSSVSAARVVQRLAGSTESDSLMLVLAEEFGDAPLDQLLNRSPAALIDPELGYPLLPATVDEDAPDPGEDLEYHGFLHLSIPHLEDRAMVEMECVLDAAHQPVPGQPLENDAAGVYRRLLAEGEALTRRLGRRVIQLWQTHALADDPGAAAIARELRRSGFHPDLEEVQGVIELFELSRLTPGLPAGIRLEHFHSHAVPDSMVEGVLDLLHRASLDVPSGGLYLELQRWSRERLAEAEARRLDTGLEMLLSVLCDAQGPIALSENHRHPASEPGTMEQGVTVVAPRARGLGLGGCLKHRALLAAQEKWPTVERVYSSNARSNTAMLTINRRLGMREISRGTAWQKILG